MPGGLLDSLFFIKREVGIYLGATAFYNSWKNFEIFKFSSDDRHIDIGYENILASQRMVKYRLALQKMCQPL